MRQMQEFDSSASASVQPHNVVRVGGGKVEEEEGKKRSKFAEMRASEKKKLKSKEEPIVLKAVVSERQTNSDQVHAPVGTANLSFPPVLKLDPDAVMKGATKKKSLFAQQVAKDTKQHTSTIEEMDTWVPSTCKRDWGSESKILAPMSSVLSAKDIQDIHEANASMLDSRTEEQLAQDREELLKSTDPTIIQFLMSRRQKATGEQKRNPEVKKKEVIPNVEGSKLSKYVHMDRLEKEKVEWMEDLPPNEEESEEPPSNFSARFDLKGDLLPFDSKDIPVNAGLHHHGEEPGRPGYTLDELLTLCRSSNAQQKSLAIQALTGVIRNAKRGRYDSCFGNVNIFKTLLDADLVTLLRISLDDHPTPGLVYNTLNCLAETLDNTVDEVVLDLYFFQSACLGYVQPCLRTALSTDKAFQTEQSELKDFEVMQADVILALVARMSILDRLAYLMTDMVPENKPITSPVLRVLTAMARHSMTVANMIAKHSNLLDLLVTICLNQSKDSKEASTHVLKLMRVLMSWGRNLAAFLAQKYDLGPKLMRYMSEVENGSLVHPPLAIEAARVWTVSLRYGLHLDWIVYFHSVLMEQAVFMHGQIENMLEKNPSEAYFRFMNGSLQMINAAIYCVDAQQQNLSWPFINGLLEPLEGCLKMCAARINSAAIKPYFLDYVASLLNVFCSYFKVYPNKPDYSPDQLVPLVDRMAQYVSGHLLNYSQTVLAKKALESSMYCSKNYKDGRRRDPDNMLSMGSVTFKGPHIYNEVPFNFLASLLDFCCTTLTIKGPHDGIQLSKFLKDPLVEEYVTLIVSGGSTKARSNWFFKPEVNFIRLLIKSSTMVQQGLNASQTWHLALVALTHCQVGEEHQAQWLMANVVFHASYVDPVLVASKVLDLSLNEDSVLVRKDLNLPYLLKLYESHIFTKEGLTKSAALWTPKPSQTHSLTIDSRGETILPPTDWQYLPVLSLYELRRKNNKEDTKADAVEVDKVYNCLLWVYLADTSIGQFSNRRTCLRYTRLATVFLASSDLFLEGRIRQLTETCLKDSLATCPTPPVFDTVPGIDSFLDFYKELVNQFAAVSYGDSLFATIIMVPLTIKNSWQHKSVLWIDNRDALRNMHICGLPKPLTIDQFCPETNQDIMQAYLGALASKAVVKERNPLLYSIAERNIQLYSSTHAAFKQQVSNLLPQFW